jgi:REP element-mobilizing transposase RayT
MDMKSDPKIHPFDGAQGRHRRSIRLKGYDYSQAGGYYVTIVSLWRECLFGEVVDGGMRVNALGKIVQDCWEEIPVHFPNVVVDMFVVMPNHVHGIIIHEKEFSVVVGAQHAAPLHAPQQGMTPNVRPGSLRAIVRSFKSAVTRRAGRELNSANIWQRNYYEHIIRDQADYERIAGYILANPVNWNDDEENPRNATMREY